MIKSAYFTTRTINRKSAQMMEMLNDLDLVHTSLKINPKKAALLVLDMQKYFLEKDSHAYIPSALAIIPGIQKLIAEAISNQMPIIYTRHSNKPETAGMMANWWKELMLIDSPKSSIIDELDTTKGEVILKERYDAFWETSLDENLRKRGIEQVIITGVMTHLCCETTARSAFIRDYQVFFVVDSTATYSEKMHMATLLNISHGFAKPILYNEVLAE